MNKPAANNRYKPLLVMGLRWLVLLATLCYLDNKAPWKRNGSYLQALAVMQNQIDRYNFEK